MSAAAAMLGTLVERRADDRWLDRRAPAARASLRMGLFLLASVGLHGAIVATAVLERHAGVPDPEKEIAVEIVRDMPKPPPHQAVADPKFGPVTPAQKPPPVRTADAPKPLPLAKPLPPSKPVPPPMPAPLAKSAPPAEPSAADARIKSLQSELAQLRAARAELEAERAAQRALPAAPPAADQLGPLPDSFQAVALPTSVDGVGEAMSYQAIVFSQLAKAKGIGRHLGLPGSAGVRFEVDARGRLLSAEIVVSSGVTSLDEEALAIVRKAAPFPAPPQGAQRVFSANVNFVTEGRT